MTKDELVVGAKVVCTHWTCRGQVGFIDSINATGSYTVKDSNNKPIGGSWGSLNSWDLYFIKPKASDIDPVFVAKIIKNNYVNKECPCGIQSIQCDYHK